MGQLSSQEGNHGDDGFLLREVELGLSGYVDPFSRADIFLGIHRSHDEENHAHYSLHLEEAYLTVLSLGNDLQAKAGKFRANIGKANPNHLHALPWPDYPSVIQSLLGEEALAGTGLSFSRLLPAKGRFRELTYEIFDTDSHALFGGEGLAHVLHFKDFYEFSPSATLELGLTGMSGKNEHHEGKGNSHLAALDLTYKWRPLRRGLYRAFLAQAELLFASKQLDADTVRPRGGYAAIERQKGRRSRYGIRLDYSQLPENPDQRERAASAYFTYMQSEFAFWRLTYSFVDRNFATETGEDEHRLSLQLNFGLGPHRAHEY